MPSTSASDSPCPVVRSLAVFGDAWSMLILRDANLGLTRFEQFRKSLDVAPTLLTRRLAALTDEGLLERRRYSERPPRDEYLLTDAGRDVLPVLFLIGAWGRKHRGAGKLTRFLDARTGADIQAVAIDASTGARIGSREFRMAVPR